VKKEKNMEKKLKKIKIGIKVVPEKLRLKIVDRQLSWIW
jgi:hypothetical protein